MKNTLRQYLLDFTHLFFPHHCTGCGTDDLADGQWLCAACLCSLPETGFLAIPGNPVEQVFYGRLPLQEAGSAFYFTKDSVLQRLLFHIKYHAGQQAGVYLGKLLGKQLACSGRFTGIDLLLPLPLNSRKQRQRGYNQAALLAEGVASVCSWPLVTQAVERRMFTATQTQQDRISRWQNMEGAFAVTDAGLLKNKHVLLIDDVLTTGATLEACGRCLLEVPGLRLSIVTAAYTIK
jgi:ComF family protein